MNSPTIGTSTQANTNAGIAASDQQLIGYWGSGDSPTAVNILTDLLTGAPAPTVLCRPAQVTDLKNQPVGVFLSGGLDSSVVAALLVRLGMNVHAYTLDFGSQGVPEYPYAEQVAEHLRIPLVKVAAGPQQIAAALAGTIVALDIPYDDGVTLVSTQFVWFFCSG